MHETDDAFDLIALVMVLAIFVPIMVMISIPYFKGEVGGFNVKIEKTALETQAEIIPIQREIFSEDILLSLVVADRHTPPPQRVRINTGGAPWTIELNEAFHVNKGAFLNQYAQSMHSNTLVRTLLYVGPTNPSDSLGISGMRFWDIQLQD